MSRRDAERAAELRAKATEEIAAAIGGVEGTVARVNLALEEVRGALGRSAEEPASLRVASAKVEAVEAEVRALPDRREREAGFADEWHRRAEQAVLAGRDDVARDALAREKEHRALIASLSHEHATASGVLGELRKLLDFAERASEPE